MKKDNIDTVLKAIEERRGIYALGEEHLIDFLIPANLTVKDRQKLRRIQEYIGERYDIDLRLVAGSGGCSRLTFQVNSKEEIVELMKAVANDPKLYEMIKELGGDFRIITSNPYQSVGAHDKDEVLNASRACASFTRGNRFTHIIEKSSDGVYVERIVSDGKVLFQAEGNDTIDALSKRFLKVLEDIDMEEKIGLTKRLKLEDTVDDYRYKMTKGILQNNGVCFFMTNMRS